MDINTSGLEQLFLGVNIARILIEVMIFTWVKSYSWSERDGFISLKKKI